jgi:hypothetical protein
LSDFPLVRNKLQGSIPPHIHFLNNPTFLNLSGALVNGIIQPLGNLINIEGLGLGNNILKGSIPNAFGKLQ